MANKTSEHTEQCKFFEYCIWKANADSRYGMVVATPNAAKRSFVVGKRMKREGLKKGFPDISCLVPNSTYHGLFIEMKVKPNKCSKEQQEWIDKLNGSGYLAVVAWSGDEAISIFESYLMFT